MAVHLSKCETGTIEDLLTKQGEERRELGRELRNEPIGDIAILMNRMGDMETGMELMVEVLRSQKRTIGLLFQALAAPEKDRDGVLITVLGEMEETTEHLYRMRS